MSRERWAFCYFGNFVMFSSLEVFIQYPANPRGRSAAAQPSSFLCFSKWSRLALWPNLVPLCFLLSHDHLPSLISDTLGSRGAYYGHQSRMLLTRLLLHCASISSAVSSCFFTVTFMGILAKCSPGPRDHSECHSACF